MANSPQLGTNLARTVSEYNTLGGTFDASKGELHKVNVTAGAGGRPYMNVFDKPNDQS